MEACVPVLTVACQSRHSHSFGGKHHSEAKQVPEAKHRRILGCDVVFAQETDVAPSCCPTVPLISLGCSHRPAPLRSMLTWAADIQPPGTIVNPGLIASWARLLPSVFPLFHLEVFPHESLWWPRGAPCHADWCVPALRACGCGPAPGPGGHSARRCNDSNRHLEIREPTGH